MLADRFKWTPEILDNMYHDELIKWHKQLNELIDLEEDIIEDGAE